MNFKTSHFLISGFILLAGCPGYVIAVTNAELEALEKQIEQQEAESKRKAEEEAKRKADVEARQLRINL